MFHLLSVFWGCSYITRWHGEATKQNMAGRQGFEPRLHGSEPRVLPLNDLPALTKGQAQNFQL